MGLIESGLLYRRRYRQIVEILIKHGLGFLVKQIHLHTVLPVHKRYIEYKFPEDLRITWAERIRLILEDLGPTFVKAGQILSTRPDLIPYEFIKEFEKLTDKAPAFSFKKVKEIIEKEYGKPIKQVFKSFEKNPLAAASLGQVHKAVLKDGTVVAVKVQRPGVEEVIKQDIKILETVAKLAEENLPEFRRYKPTQIVAEYTRTIKNELNYVREARNVEKFYRNFRGDETVKIPAVYNEYTTKKVLVLEFLKGEKITDWLKKKPTQKARRKITVNIVHSFLKQILEHGFFQADPHSGNILVMKGNVIGLIDFGMVGHIDADLKEKITRIFVGIFQQNTQKIAKEFLKIGAISVETDMEAFKRDVSESIEQYYGTPLAQIKIEEMVQDINSIFIHHQIRIPPNFTLLLKAIAESEGILRQTDPTYNFTTTANKFIRRMFKERVTGKKLLERTAKQVLDLSEMLSQFPFRLDHILSIFERGVVNVEFQHKGFEKLSTNIGETGNKLAFSLIISAFIMSSSLIIHSNLGPTLWGFPALGVLVFLITGIIGVWWMITSLYKGEI